jgi:hypothetical protein
MVESSVVEVRGRLNSADADQLVRENEQSRMMPQMFSRVRGIPVRKLDSYRRKRRRLVQTSTMAQLVPAELIEVSQSRSILRIESSSGCRIAVEKGFRPSLCISITQRLPNLN